MHPSLVLHVAECDVIVLSLSLFSANFLVSENAYNDRKNFRIYEIIVGIP